MLALVNIMANPRAQDITRLRDGLPPICIKGIVTTSDIVVDDITERQTTLRVELDVDVLDHDIIDIDGVRWGTVNRVDSPHTNSKSFVLRESSQKTELIV